MPLVSVVIPAYNAEAFVGEAILSIRQQSWKDLEIIVVDDGSHDGTYQVALEHAERDSRVVVHRHSENLGITAAPNSGIALAGGEWIAMLDADDLAQPERIENQLRTATARKLDLVGTQVEIFGSRQDRSHFPVSDAAMRHQLFLWKNPIANPSVMVRREILQSYPYSERYSHGQDYALWLRLSLDASIRMGNCDQPLVRYRAHSGQNTSTNLERVRTACFAALQDTLLEAGWFDARAFETHKKGFNRRKVIEAEEARHYLEWLIFLCDELTQRYGRSSEFADYWLKLCRRSQYQLPVRADCIKRLKGSGGQRLKYWYKRVAING